MLALGTAVCGVAFLEDSAREAPQLIEEKVPVLGSHWGSVWEAKDPVEFFVWDSGFFPRPYVVGTLGTRVGLPLPAAGLYHSALVCVFKGYSWRVFSPKESKAMKGRSRAECFSPDAPKNSLKDQQQLSVNP